MPTAETTSRPRMAAINAFGAVRARRWHGEGDLRGYLPPSGWTARADLTDIHPHHGPRLAARRVDHRDEGMKPAPGPGRSDLGREGFKNPGAAVAAPGVEVEQPGQNETAHAVAQVVALQ